MSSKLNNYSKLEKKKFEEITHLGNIAMIAHWDSATMLQKGSASSKQKEMATFSSVLHGMQTSPEIGDLIEGSLEEFDHLDDWQKSNLANIKKSYDNPKKSSRKQNML
jgi:Zn-dependent M32 family carboxypeptidase